MMTKEEKMEYIIRHYKLMTAKEIATKLGMSQWMVYDYIKQSGLRNKNRDRNGLQYPRRETVCP